MEKKKILLILSVPIILALIIIGFITFDIIPIDQSKGEFVVLGQYEGNGECRKVKVFGDIAYILDKTPQGTGLGLSLIDVSDPSNPKHLGSYFESGIIYDFEIVDNLAYCANMQNGLEILNISDYNNIHRISHYRSGTPIFSVEVVNGIAYIGAGTLGVEILNITNAAAPIRLSSISVDNKATQVKIDDQVCYVIDHGNSFSNIESYNVSNSKTPVKMGEYIIQGVDFFNLLIKDNFLITTDHGEAEVGALYILNIEDPSEISEISTFRSNDTPFGVSIGESIVYTTEYETGLVAVDISNPNSPKELGRTHEGGEAFDVCYTEGYIYFADGINGLKIMQFNIEDES
ncbi:hypothetical protein NEF87_003852 [Candidatus Lokiarchaeum ossiferum]|uniref:LVIVD repeat protein n=1 Tax=Candidatus Lokiarchaeum ossiferum TaxID=2951803 RepID=A0ABY6HVL6_9ARCH|nr:hypothetical protein NEF87_003852 [Candidatus Lokiarchaeum sp. B-35]